MEGPPDKAMAQEEQGRHKSPAEGRKRQARDEGALRTVRHRSHVAERPSRGSHKVPAMQVDPPIRIRELHSKPDGPDQPHCNGQEDGPRQAPVRPFCGGGQLQAVDHRVHHVGCGLPHPHRAESESRHIPQTEHPRPKAAHDESLRGHRRLASGQAGLADDTGQPDVHHQRASHQQHRHIERESGQDQPGHHEH